MSQTLDIQTDAEGRIVGLSGNFSKQTNSNGAEDHFAPDSVSLTVPENTEAHVTASMTVDDWGYIDITPASGASIRAIDLTSSVESPGPRGGHVRWSAQTSDAIVLAPGQYSITVRQDNAPYNEAYAAQAGNNVSFCQASVTIEYVAILSPVKTISVLTADEYGEIDATGTTCAGYIKSGGRVSNGKHAISVGLEYSGPSPDPDFGPVPSSSIASDNFTPSHIELDSSGKARFKVWTMGNTGNPSVVSLNGATSEPISYLPAVFEDKFEVTVYYTIRERGCTSSSDTTKLQTVYIGQSGRTTSYEDLNAEFVEAVKLEGNGLLKDAFVDSETGDVYPYLSYDYSQNTWTFRKFPVGNMENEIYRGHCAGSSSDLTNGSQIKLLLSDALISAFGGDTFTMADVGEGIRYHHIDLYWGEDDPLRGDASLGIPQGLNCELPSGTTIRGILVRE